MKNKHILRACSAIPLFYTTWLEMLTVYIYRDFDTVHNSKHFLWYYSPSREVQIALPDPLRRRGGVSIGYLYFNFFYKVLVLFNVLILVFRMFYK